MRRCFEGGLLVGAQDAIGAAEDARWSKFTPRFGCGNLRCARCGQTVQNHPEDTYRRTYTCACVTLTLMNPGPAPNPEPDFPYDASTPWACAGHPDLVGVDRSAVSAALDDLSSVAALLRRWPGFAAARLCDAAGDAKADLLGFLAETALVDASDVRVARAVRALSCFPLEPAAGRLAEAPITRWSRPDPDASFEPTSMSVALVFGPRVQPSFGDRDALRALHALAVVPPGVGPALFPAIWADPAWAVANVDAISATAPDAWKHLLDALKQRPEDAVSVAKQLAARGTPVAEILALAQRWNGPARDAVAAALAPPLTRGAMRGDG